MIYFGNDTKRAAVARIAATLRPGGSLVIGHAETLNGLGLDLRHRRPVGVPAGGSVICHR